MHAKSGYQCCKFDPALNIFPSNGCDEHGIISIIFLKRQHLLTDWRIRKTYFAKQAAPNPFFLHAAVADAQVRDKK